MKNRHEGDVYDGPVAALEQENAELKTKLAEARELNALLQERVRQFEEQMQLLNKSRLPAAVQKAAAAHVELGFTHEEALQLAIRDCSAKAVKASPKPVETTAKA